MRRASSAVLAGALLYWATAGCEGRPVFDPAEWVKIPAGTFSMGSPTTENCREAGEFQETLHQVTLTRSYEMPTTEVTQGQFEDKQGYNPSHFVECGANCPVDGVSWSEAAAYCNALSESDGLAPCYTCSGEGGGVNCEVSAAYEADKIYTCPGYRLPTEAEWERACRADTSTPLYNGEIHECTDFDTGASAIAWYHANSGQSIHQAKRKQANDWGLFDMSGNVWEWVHDWFASDLGSASVKDPSGPAGPTLGRVLRGGSAEVPAHLVRCASRHNYAPPTEMYRLRFHGFRCARTKD